MGARVCLPDESADRWKPDAGHRLAWRSLEDLFCVGKAKMCRVRNAVDELRMLAMADHTDITQRIHREWEEDAYVLTHTARDFGVLFGGRRGVNNKDDDNSKYSAGVVWLMPVTESWGEESTVKEVCTPLPHGTTVTHDML